MAESLPPSVRDGLIEMAVEPRRLGWPEKFVRLTHDIVENTYLNAECVRLDAGIRPAAR